MRVDIFVYEIPGETGNKLMVDGKLKKGPRNIFIEFFRDFEKKFKNDIEHAVDERRRASTRKTKQTDENMKKKRFQKQPKERNGFRGGEFKIICGLGVTVTKTNSEKSSIVDKLPNGTHVIVVEQDKARARITKPVEGWINLTNSQGYLLVKRIGSLSSNVTIPKFLTISKVKRIFAGYCMNNDLLRIGLVFPEHRKKFYFDVPRFTEVNR
eukprot:UN32482